MATNFDLETIKKEMDSVLLTARGGVEANSLNDLYSSVVGYDIPFKSLGYSYLLQFLKTIDDIIVLEKNHSGQLWVRPLPTATTAHIARLVRDQRPSAVSKKKQKPPRILQSFSEKRISNVSGFSRKPLGFFPLNSSTGDPAPPQIDHPSFPSYTNNNNYTNGNYSNSTLGYPTRETSRTPLAHQAPTVSQSAYSSANNNIGGNNSGIDSSSTSSIERQEPAGGLLLPSPEKPVEAKSSLDKLVSFYN